MIRILVTRLLAAFLAVLMPGATMAQSLEKVEILIDWKALPTFAGIFLAKQLGAFERRGLDVTVVEVQGALMSAEMIGKGDRYWIGTSSGMATVLGRAKGLPIKSLAVYYRETPSVIFSRTEDRIAHPRDLYGKTLGVVPGSITNEELRAMFAINRLDLSQVKLVDVEWDPFDLLEKKVDALIDYEEMTPATLLSEGRRILSLRLSDFGVKTYSLNLIVNENAWSQPEKRAIALKIAEAVNEGYSIVKDRPSDASLHFSRMFPRLSPNYVVRGMVSVAQQLGHPPLGVQTRKGWENTINLMSSLNLLSRPVTVEEMMVSD